MLKGQVGVDLSKSKASRSRQHFSQLGCLEMSLEDIQSRRMPRPVLLAVWTLLLPLEPFDY